jgi:hypothetical protein
MPRLENRGFYKPLACPLVAERPRVVSVCRRIRGTKPAHDLIGKKVRPDKVSCRFRCDCRLLHAIDLLLNYSQLGRIPSSNIIPSRVPTSLALVNETRTNRTEALLVPSWSHRPPRPARTPGAP